MQSVIIVSKEKGVGEKYAHTLCIEQGVGPIDITIVKNNEEEVKKQTIGISHIRTLLQTIFLKPISGTKKAIIIPDAHTLTTEAQNAMLKILEEPPPGTLLILVVNKKENLLPTILSRCTFFELKDPETASNEDSEFLFSRLLSNGSKGKLKLAQDIGTERSEVLNWIENAIQTLRKKLISEVSEEQLNNRTIEQSVSLLRSLQKTYTTIQTTNVSPRLLLENLMLGNS